MIGTITSAPKSVIKNIKPAAGIGSEIPYQNSRASSVKQTLTGSALISALSAQIEGFIATGWADQTIINYFLNPGRPGYLQYPGLTRGQFKQAAAGILSDASLLQV